ncbi:hypothetical protein [Methylocystis heyeri]|uniref:Uncharacterized protein n=1 Tax=Methylocystis heyeri TaxID=391905 RepID=A0A6B8KM25_9HYPH|nr:hypothetical protein [Methylocystis heyeri]QGM47843.1 hypothetical protein H2LOC_020385 [Methylocystis heyeri]
MSNYPRKPGTPLEIAFQQGLDDRDFGRGPPIEPDPETAEDCDDWAIFDARREAYDSRSDYDEDGEFTGND